MLALKRSLPQHDPLPLGWTFFRMKIVMKSGVVGIRMDRGSSNREIINKKQIKNWRSHSILKNSQFYIFTTAAVDQIQRISKKVTERIDTERGNSIKRFQFVKHLNKLFSQMTQGLGLRNDNQREGKEDPQQEFSYQNHTGKQI